MQDWFTPTCYALRHRGRLEFLSDFNILKVHHKNICAVINTLVDQDGCEYTFPVNTDKAGKVSQTCIMVACSCVQKFFKKLLSTGNHDVASL